MKRLLILLTILITTYLCAAQETGCFKVAANNELTLKTNIDFSSYSAFYVGEFHGVYGISEIKLALIKYLNTQYGVTDVFMEFSYSAAWLYNRYLATGDTSLFTDPLLVYAQKQSNRDFWESLYAYNRTCTHKLIIRGVDFERMEFIKALKLLMPPGKEKPAAILPTLSFIDTAVIQSVARVNSGMLDSVYQRIQNDITIHRGIYEQYYGANFKTVEQIMFNKNTFKKYQVRNKTMYDNLMAQVKRDGIQKFVTFNGLNHTNKANPGWRGMCYRISRNHTFKHKLVNIAMTCKNCYDWQLAPQYRNAAFRGPYTYGRDSVLMSSIYEKHFNTGCRYTLLPSATTGDNKVSKFSDYIILMKDQPEF